MWKINISISKYDYSGTSGKIRSVSSKSEAHRLMTASALSDKITDIYLNQSSNDILATSHCLKSLGAKVEGLPDEDETAFDSEFNDIFYQDKSKKILKDGKDGFHVRVSPAENIPSSAVFDCGESGSTIRFLMPVAAALGIDSIFTGSGRLPGRPQDILLNQMRTHGVNVSPDGEFPIKFSGKMNGGNFKYPGNVSSQYTTGLLLAIPLIKEGGSIDLIEPVQSRPYIKITLDTLKKFGIKVKTSDNGDCFSIPDNSRYVSPGDLTVGGDWSNSAFWFCLGALSDFGITVTGLDINSGQGDKKILDILNEFGADISYDKENSENGITVKRKNLNGIEIDASNVPDIIPVISALAVFADGKTRVFNAGRLRLKESDRLDAIAKMIETVGGKTDQTEDSITIYGGCALKENMVYSSFNDHRMVMAETIICSKLSGTILNAEAVNKSYPLFFKDVKNLKKNY